LAVYVVNETSLSRCSVNKDKIMGKLTKLGFDNFFHALLKYLTSSLDYNIEEPKLF